ncbi:MAG: hypothetical protein DMG98_18730 [Acidobacteria bacterium]|nr:MAG: hypothetical protein DMG98_18730 [Acidobacteriota bacterium]
MLAAFRQERQCDFALITKICAASTSLLNGSTTPPPEAAIHEINPDKLAICIGAAEQAIAQRESLVDTTELERHKLADARSMLKSLSRIASSQGKQAAYEAAQPTQHND